MNRTLLSLLPMAAIWCGVATADEAAAPRAKPPAEWPRDVREVFFDDAREQLVGSRPNYGEVAAAAKQANSAAPLAGSETADASQGFAWSKLVTADVIESEIKRQLTPLQPLVATPATFKGGGYRECRNRFTWLATLFAVAGDYDDSVRWKDSATALAQLYGRAGANCKVGTDQSFRESELRVQDLADLIRGGRPTVDDAQPDVGWDRIADRSPLMRRMEACLAEGISPNASDGRALSANAEDLAHEAQLMALMAEVIMQPGFDYYDDESYRGHSTQLRDAAVALTQAIELENFAAAREAIGNMEKACSNCHDEWR
ncbi:cytochrome c [Aeoliella mucimassa]|uniref:Cytochrome C n=1 Tax=Aeoliella mucimassa TaxID=2527972 RepID=A0A518ATN7_9BACT|nr:cytochrome c [Aeoliella mucimassa]QDU58094.1 hypothetical protein Pan181_43200 [Aeoliella mucimassa]